MGKILPRSVRANNPGNLRIGQPWQGLMPRERMTPEQKAETEFCVFADAAHGFRALATLLRTYQTKYGLDTPAQIITRFAPSSENNTQAYINAFAKGVASEPDAKIDLSRRMKMFWACQAIAMHEAGGWDGYWTNEQLADGLDLAGF